MASLARHHFPQFVWREGEKRLWNPIHKKALKNRPEERVRLRIIEALVEAQWSKHRISTEEKLRPKENPGGRTDVICYDQDFNPKILVECKAENVPISGNVAEQTARYNRTVEAPYLLMTNGLSDYWFRILNGQGPEQMETLPTLLNTPNRPPQRAFNYWRERGFVGEEATDTGLRKWLTEVLNILWLNAEADIRYIEFNNSPSDLELKHYFHVAQQGDNRVALGILSTPYGGTRLVAVINREGQNMGLIEVNMDLLAADTKPNATIYSEADPKNFDVGEVWPVDLSAHLDNQGPLDIPSRMNDIFDEFSN